MLINNNVSIHGKSQAPLNADHAYDVLVAKVARALVRATANEIDVEINFWLKNVAIELGLDRSTIAQIDSSTGLASFTHGWAREPYEVISQPLNASKLLPWTVRQMLADRTVVMSSPDELPEDAVIDRESFLLYGPKSNVMVPIVVGGTVVAGMSFASLLAPRKWSPEAVNGFQAIGEIFGLGLERKRTVAENLQLRDELNYVSRVSTMGELAASMTHELNQPLGAILNNAESLQAMIESGIADVGEIQACIDDIIQDNNRAQETIQRVWTLFQRKQVISSKIDLNECLTKIFHILRSDARLRRIDLQLNVPEWLPLVVAESIQLQQAVINLVLNAFDAVAGNHCRPREVRLTAMASVDADCVEILVSDNGPGIPLEVMSRIFDPFFTTKSKGMGMGLAIARSIITAYEGSLSVTLNASQGATFVIKLPVATAEGG